MARSGMIGAAALAVTSVALTAAGEGTPGFARLRDASDRQAFRGWFTFLAEVQFFQPLAPAEVKDCAALVRFAYREALRKHDGAWAATLALPDVPPLGSVRQYNYPFTPLGAGLFRVRPGEFAETDLRNGAFAEFADASTLMRFNAYRVTREMSEAAPGDLLFFHQPGQRFPYHVMVFVGESRVQPGTGPFVVYHTGPDSRSAGEIRRPSLPELYSHPNPQWRPNRGNQNFLGVFRWNILAG